MVLRYLCEQGVLDGERDAFADAGWRGPQHGVLLELQEAVDGSALFFCLDASASPWGGHRGAYVVDSRVGGAPTGGDRAPVSGPAYLPDPSRPGGARSASRSPPSSRSSAPAATARSPTTTRPTTGRRGGYTGRASEKSTGGARFRRRLSRQGKRVEKHGSSR